jgi:peptidoglycan/LPS O-acetylase OafA/YrhL
LGESGPATAARGRLDYVDGIRALAAIYVVLHHIWITTYPDYPRNSGPIQVGWMAYGQVAVAVFIVVSGFSLSIAPASHGWRLSGGVGTFVRRRAWRILPTYWAALALSCIVFGLITPAQTGHDVSLKAILVHGVLVQDVINSPKPNGAFWSIAVEWQIYFLFPLFLLIRRRLGAAVLSVTVIAGVVLAYEAATHAASFSRILNVTPQFTALFVFGIVAAGVVRAGEGSRWLGLLPWGFSLLAASFAGLCAIKGSVWIDAHYFWVDVLVGVATAFLLASLAHGRPRWIRAVLAGKILSGAGLFSYSIYCVHLPVLWLVWHFGISRFGLSTGEKFSALVLIGLPLAIFCSYWFSRIFEMPFLTHRSLMSVREAITISIQRRRALKGSRRGTHAAVLPVESVLEVGD